MPHPAYPDPPSPTGPSESRREFEQPLAAVARFLGHSVAAALGFAGLAAISLLPIAAVRVLNAFGVDDLALRLHALEAMLEIVDLLLFTAVFLAGAIVFLAEVYIDGERRIIEAFKRRRT
jgi:hypothetical protein